LQPDKNSTENLAKLFATTPYDRKLLPCNKIETRQKISEKVKNYLAMYFNLVYTRKKCTARGVQYAGEDRQEFHRKFRKF
jgi:hypothetical protein